jgi:hypothetical protein
MIGRTALVAAALAGYALSIHSAAIVTRDMRTGDGSMAQLRPGPRYEALRVPDTPFTARFQAGNRVAADFAQIYFVSREPGDLSLAYSDDTSDPWQRPSRYAPFVHWVCAQTICQLPYGDASVLHMGIQYLIFIVSFAYACVTLRVHRHLLVALAAVHVGLFLTPVGLSWLERGQFSLYIGAAYIWLLLGIYRSSAVYLALAAVLAFVKWTSFPMFFVLLGTWMLAASDRSQFMQRVWLTAVPVTVIATLVLIFPGAGLAFVEGITLQESAFAPDGLSLARLVPRGLVKAIPLALVAIAVARSRRYRVEFSQLLPVVLASAILLQLYPTWAYDYSVPSLFAFIPFAIHWANRQQAHQVWAQGTAVLFFGFLAVASAITIADVVATFDVDLALIVGYVACAVALLLVPLSPSPVPHAGSS